MRGQRQDLGVDYFKKLAEMKPSYLVRSEQIASRVVSGEICSPSPACRHRAYQEQPERRDG